MKTALAGGRVASDCGPATAEGCMEFAAEGALERFAGVGGGASGIVRASRPRGTPLVRISNREIPFGGDSSTVNVGPCDFSMGAGPSYRHVADLSDNDESVLIHPMGQSGNVLSGDFDNLPDMWAEGEYLPMRTSGYEVKETLTLEPGG